MYEHLLFDLLKTYDKKKMLNFYIQSYNFI